MWSEDERFVNSANTSIELTVVKLCSIAGMDRFTSANTETFLSQLKKRTFSQMEPLST